MVISRIQGFKILVVLTSHDSDCSVNVPLDSIGQDSKRFVQHVKECQVKKDYPGILAVFPTVGMLKKEQPEIHAKALKYCNEENRHMFGKLIRDIEMAGANALDAFVDGIKSDSKKTDENLPRDGTVHQMTSDALLFIEQLQVFPEVAGGMIATKKSDGSASAAQGNNNFFVNLISFKSFSKASIWRVHFKMLLCDRRFSRIESAKL